MLENVTEGSIIYIDSVAVRVGDITEVDPRLGVYASWRISGDVVDPESADVKEQLALEEKWARFQNPTCVADYGLSFSLEEMQKFPAGRKALAALPAQGIDSVTNNGKGEKCT